MNDNSQVTRTEYISPNVTTQKKEVLESVMCDVIKIRLKMRVATRSGKGN